MSSEDKKIKCASCGLVSTNATLRDHHGFQLCSFCTLDHTVEPNYEAIVYSVAVGYFINEKHIENVDEALERALEFVSQRSYWQDKELPLPTLTGLNNVRLAISLSSNMKTLEYEEDLLEYPDFFISHKWHKECDPELVEPLVTSLRERGFRIWYDKATWGEETGKTTDWMDRGIQNARYVVPILCKDYFKSDNCRFELKQILDKTEDHKRVFPIWWHDINPNFLKTQERGKELLEIISITWDEIGADIEELVSELVKRVNAAEGLKEYNGVTLHDNEVRFLEQLETLVHEPIPPQFFPFKSSEDYDTPEFGFYQENNMITALFLKNKGLKGLPKAIGNLSNLKELDLSNNQLSSLPESLGSLSSIELLNLDGNPLRALPASFIRLKKILSKKYPNLDEAEAVILTLLEAIISNPIPCISSDKDSVLNEKESIPKSLLYPSRLPTMEEIFGFVTENNHIIALGLPNQGLKFLPEAFYQLNHLRKLNLGGNNIKILSESIVNLVELEELLLYNAELTSLPSNIGWLPQLQVLDLKHNQLSSLPKTISDLGKLKYLDLSHNQLTSLPEEFGTLEYLERLNFQNNMLHSLPSSISQLINLKMLGVGGNQLESLPEMIGNLKKLEELFLWNNALSSLPESIGRLKNLQLLNLGGNQLSFLPEIFQDLQKLRVLDLNWNQLTSLPKTLENLTSLQRLFLRRNLLNQLPEFIGKLTSLTNLDLSHNNLKELPTTFKDLIKLTSLWLNSNNLTSLSEYISKFKDLRKLVLNDNPLAASNEERDKIEQLIPPNCKIEWE